MAWFSLFRGSNKRIAPAESAPHKDTKMERPNKKRRLVAEPRTLREEALISDDILHQIFGFFINDGYSRTVDADSLLSAMLVCKQWKKAAGSCALWSTPRSTYSNPVRRALSLKDITSSELENSDPNNTKDANEEPRLSLFGFQKMSSSKADSEDANTLFRVLNRATNKPCTLCVAPCNVKSSQMMNQIFEAHFFQADKCFLDETNVSEDVFMRKQFPSGVVVRENRVIRWYDDDRESNEIFQRPVFTPSFAGSRNGRGINKKCPKFDFMEGRIRLCHSFEHLRKLEEATADLDISDHLSVHNWAMIVDWIVEIMQCFNLEERIIFQTMSLFRKVGSRLKTWRHLFLRDCQQSVFTKKNYQLIASACMLIACKCNMESIRAIDFVFCSDNSYTLETLSLVEELILETLQWRLAIPTTLDFVYAYAKLENVDGLSQMMNLMEYIAALALQSQIHVEYESSLIAAAVVVLARYSLGEGSRPFWNTTMVATTGYSQDEVYRCTVSLSQCLDEVRQSGPALTMIRRRFRRITRQNVGKISIPSISSTMMLRS